VKQQRLNVIRYEKNRMESQVYLRQLESQSEAYDRIMRDLSERMKTTRIDVSEETECAEFIRYVICQINTTTITNHNNNKYTEQIFKVLDIIETN